MSALARILSEYLSSELSNALGSDLGSTLRVFFSGPPKRELDGLFLELTRASGHLSLEVSGQHFQINVYQLEQGIEDPKEVTSSDKCTESHFVSAIRNNVNVPYCLVLQEHVSAVQSVDSTVTRLGIGHEYRELSDWRASALVHGLLERILKKISLKIPDDRLYDAIDYALEQAWEADEKYRDKRSAWNILAKLSELVVADDISLDKLSASLGLFKCEMDEFGKSRHLSVTGRLCDYLKSNGLSGGFSAISAGADQNLSNSLSDFRNFIENQGVIEASEFARNPLEIVSRIANKNEALPDWWNKLTIYAWAELLDVEPEVDLDAKLVFEPLDTFPVYSKSVPNLSQSAVKFRLTALDIEDPIEIVISRANGSAAFQSHSTLTLADQGGAIFLDRDVPVHQRFIRYKIEASGFYAVTVKFIVLDAYGPGLVVDSRTAKSTKLFTRNKKARDQAGNVIERFESDVTFPGMGSHQFDLYFGQFVKLPDSVSGYEIDAEQEGQLDRPVNLQGDQQAVCLIETDEECYYEFTAAVNGEGQHFRVYITAGDEPPAGVESEFDRLVLSHRSSTSDEYSSARVEPSNNRLATFEEWILESNDSSCPVILGPDFLDCWRKPLWANAPILSNFQMLVDPRPENWLSRVPRAYKDARFNLLEHIRQREGEITPSAVVIRLHEYMRDEEFVNSVTSLLLAYIGWLESDYEAAVWSDTISILDQQATAEALESEPYAVLLSPYHPIRLAWQCQAQNVLQEALEKHNLCPAASTFTPSRFPDCILLGCESAMGTVKKLPYISMTTSNDYWSVLWSTERIGGPDEARLSSVISSGLGIALQGISSGFSAQQVVRSLDEVSRLVSARSTLKVSIISDEAGGSDCNDGLQAWSLANLGAEEDEWHGAGSMSLVVSDRRAESQQPEQSVLSSLTNRTIGSVKWYTTSSQPSDQDLSIVAHLGTMNHEFSQQGIRSAVDYSGLIRWRIRKQQPGAYSAFVGESFVGEMPDSPNKTSYNGAMLQAVDILESKCASVVDSYVFAPNLSTLDEVVGSSAYTAVSSSNVDAACFFGSTQRAYLWDYELPSYSRRAGENSGYFLLASQSEGMLRAVRSALQLLGPSEDFSDDYIADLLVEISKRGMPTLKRLTGGGTLSMGELGMLIALRMLQYDFIQGRSDGGVLPVFSPGEAVNLVIPADPFQSHFEDLRKSLQDKSGERPDMLVLSIAFSRSGEPKKLRITPVEVKARGDVMKSKERVAALAQANHFSNFLRAFQAKAGEVALWGVAWRDLLSTILDYGFRVYGQLDHLMAHSAWTTSHASTLKRLGEGLLEVEIDNRGRLIVVDGSSSSFPFDVDGDSYEETVVLSHSDALKLLSDEASDFLTSIQGVLGTWDLIAEANGGAEDLQEASQEPQSDQAAEDSCSASSDLGGLKAENQLDKEAVVGSEDSERYLGRVADEGLAYGPVLDVNEQSGSGKNDEPKQRNQGEGDEALDEQRGIRFDVGKTIGGFVEEELEFFPGNTALNQLNIGIVGDLGTGKTQLIQALIYQLRRDESMNRGKKPNILIFDYKRDYSKDSFVEATGAKVVSPFNIPLNLFDTRDSLQGPNAWLERSKFFSDVLNKIFQGIGPAQREYIKQAVKEAYGRSESISGNAPTIAEVFQCYAELRGGSIDSPYSIMSDLVDGGYFVSEQAQVIPFSEFLNGIVVLDLSAVGADDRTKNMLVAIFLNLFYEHMLKLEKKEFIGTEPTLRFIDTMLLVDEADNIMKYEFDVLKKILLQGREFGVGVLLASQYMSHYKTTHENYMEPLLSWFIHKVPRINASDLEKIGLTSASAELANEIRSLECHQCLYKSLGVDGQIIRAKPFFELIASKN